ncbi:OmpH family outer membrane protein [Porphyromonadaceae bacterium OttesenSCG-928-L07]|nr:OmpH family outer membrane protein [Porphyromonadaceae bacterium OttesenSCG-928-L07]
MMKNYSIIFNTVLCFAVVVLYILHFTGRTEEAPVSVKPSGVVTEGTKIVYVNTDTLLSNYQLSVELNEAFLKKQEERSTELNMKAKDFDRQAGEFQRKLENNGFFSRERADAARNELIQKQYQLEQLRQEMAEKMMKEQSDLSKRLIEDITVFLKEYNKEKGYDIVLSTAMYGTVLYAESGFDITNEVVQKLNENYKKSSSK